MGGVESAGGGLHGIDFRDVISIENLFEAWREFARGKRSKKDVITFELKLEDNIFRLHEDLKLNIWKPDSYTVFYVQDPKLRVIHKATVRDRVLYQAVYRSLYQTFDPGFIHDVYSSRDRKGTHAGVDRFEDFARKVTGNHTRSAFALKCDIRKFFDSIDHGILFDLICRKISDESLVRLIFQIIDSFHHTPGKGLPLGNVTSQLFANIYMNEFDQFVKHRLKVKYYIRYCDDFVILNTDRALLKGDVGRIKSFLSEKLKLDLHPRKVEIRKLIQGIDFLGYVSLPHYRVLRTRTRRRMLKKLRGNKDPQVLASYLGMLSHCSGRKIESQLPAC